MTKQMKIMGFIAATWFACTTVVVGGCGGGGGASPSPRPVPPAYRCHGPCFSPWIDIDPNAPQATVSEERIRTLLDAIAPYCRWIRTFSTTRGEEKIARLAKSRGLRVAAGCWLGRDPSVNEAQIAALFQLVQQGFVDLAVVGSETLYRRDLSEEQLISYIRRVKATGTPTATSDTWNELLQHPRVISECDVILANFHPYWEGLAIDQAVRTLHQNYLRLKQVAGDTEIIVGETGWPSAGNPFRDAVPSADNAAFYFLNFVSWARSENVKYFYFEAFDEPWKASYEGPQGAHWGIWDTNLRMKPGMNRVFNGDTVPDNWSDGGPQPGQPSIEFTYVPPYGSFEDLRGRVSGVTFSEYAVAVYIYVNNGWWTKPYWNRPLTPIRGDGTWVCDITTGGVDQYATKIIAFLVPADYSPPLASGQSQLPPEIEEVALARAEATRSPTP